MTPKSLSGGCAAPVFPSLRGDGSLRHAPRVPYMRALSVLQPWADCISHGPKRIENRTWAPPSALIGRYLAIHASGKKSSRSERAAIEYTTGYAPRADAALGAVVCVARVVGVVRSQAACAPKDAVWFMGPIGWVLDDVRAIPPLPLKGALGLWNISSEHVQTILDAAFPGVVPAEIPL